MMLPTSKLSAITLVFCDKEFQTFFIEKEISSISIEMKEFYEIKLIFLEFHKEGQQ